MTGKHPYAATCACPRCEKERGRRSAQADADPRRRTVRGRRETGLDRWARIYYETDGRNDPEDR